MAVNMESLVARLEAVAARLEAQAGAPAAAKTTASTPGAKTDAAGGVAPSVAAFDALIAGPLAELVAATGALGDAEIADATALFADAFNAERTVIECIASCRKPEMDALQSLLAPVGDLMTRVGAKSEGKRTDAFNHLKALAEAAQCLSFVAYTGPETGMSLPGPHVTETWQSAEFYANKILVQHRNSEGGDAHVTWVNSLKRLVSVATRDYAKEHHTTGPAWNPKGATSGRSSREAAPRVRRPRRRRRRRRRGRSRRAAPPPPPPPPPPPGSWD